jgi:3-oxoacyl-[acyl-carrier protein] reductase
MRLQGSNAIITGGASGLGAATARRFAKEGAKVFVCGLDDDEIKAFIRSCGDRSRAISGAVVDIAEPADCTRLVEMAEAFFEAPHDIFLANAGVSFSGRLTDAAPSLIDRAIAVNLQGAILSAQAALRSMERQHRGCLLFTSSVQGVIARPLRSVYTATKHAITGLVKGLALDAGPLGIRVNAIGPAAIDTPLLRQQLARTSDDVDAAMAKLAASMPLGRLPTADDFAAAAVFLSSDEARAITGHTLLVDSGAAAGAAESPVAQRGTGETT